MLSAAIGFDFEPGILVAGRLIRWETLALAGAIVVALALAALIAGRTERADPSLAAADLGDPNRVPGPPASAEPVPRLSRADLLIIAMAALPGALVGGRIGHVLIHLDYYTGQPNEILNLRQGSLELSLAVVGGTVTAWIVASQLEGSVGRWLHVAAAPLLLGLALGKFAMALGGTGQGLPSDAPYATAYLGPGPWGSILPEVPAHPAQIYEGLATLACLAALAAFTRLGLFRRRDGAAFLVAVGMWAEARVVVASTWQDPAVLGVLRADQLLGLALVIVVIAALEVLPWQRRRTRAAAVSLMGAPPSPGVPISRPAPVAVSAALAGTGRPPGPDRAPDRAMFLAALAALAAGGAVTPEQRAALQAVPLDRRERTWRAQRAAAEVRVLVDAALADGRLTAAEDEQLGDVARLLGLDPEGLAGGDERLARRITVARLRSGRLPVCVPSVALSRREVCHLEVTAMLVESLPERVGASNAAGLWWPADGVWPDPEGRLPGLPRRARVLDEGLLVVTSRRVQFHGLTRLVDVQNGSVAGLRLFRDGIRIVKTSGSSGPTWRLPDPALVAATASTAAAARRGRRA